MSNDTTAGPSSGGAAPLPLATRLSLAINAVKQLNPYSNLVSSPSTSDSANSMSNLGESPTATEPVGTSGGDETTTDTELVGGATPTNDAPTNSAPLANYDSTAPSAASAPKTTSTQANQAAGKTLAADNYGWTGDEWNALNSVVMRESGWNNTVQNKSSGALGIGQALGHGAQGTGGSFGNQYGGYGLSAQESKAANNGDVDAQLLWTFNYIQQRYGSPTAALQHEQQYSWY